jgi:uncharacterized protein YcfL
MRQTTLIALTILLLAACTAAPEGAYTVTVVADGEARTLVLEEAVTVSDVLTRAGIALGDLDRVNPPGFSRITDGLTITVVRVQEETVVEEVVIAFERRTTRNDGMPAGESRLLQAGVNGMAEVTYRVTYENGVEIARSEIRRIVLTEPQDEVVMVGSQGELPSVTVEGALFYLSGGNAWVIRQNSANRRPLTVDGRLDGRVFAVSSDGVRALFTQTCEDADPEDGLCNTLWAVLDTTAQEIEPIELDVQNVLYADWAPGWERIIVYSTAEPRPGFPGWQANNDLWRAQISANGATIRREELLEPSGGGVYGWYGTVFAFSPDGLTLAWAQPDAVGVLAPPYEGPEDATPTPVPRDEPPPLPDAYEQRTLLRFSPANAYDFVWVPTVAWSPDGLLVATTVHGAPLGTESSEDSPIFDLVVADAAGAYTVTLVPRAGMWSSAQYSGERIAYLLAIDPLNSTASRYRLVVADRDGSNAQTVYPPETMPGLQAQTVAWSPDGEHIALIHQGDLYILDISAGLAQQLSSDGLSSSPVWRP